MSPLVMVGAVIASGAGSLVFSTLTYSLRELSRVRLSQHLNRAGKSLYLEQTVRRAGDLVLATAMCRMVCNTAILVSVLILCDRYPIQRSSRYAIGAALGGFITTFSSVGIPNSLARYAGDAIVAAFVVPLHALLWAMWPVLAVLHVLDVLVRRAAGAPTVEEPERIEHEIEQEILSVVEEGEKEGLVDEEQREMIASVIQFDDTTSGQIMTPRPQIVALDISSTLEQVKSILEESGHSRLPVFNGTIDHVVGVLYARDLLKHLGRPAGEFNIKSAMRSAYFVPETKPVSDLLSDFRLQKVHLAIVLDEYGGTSGLVTIEDVLEEIVGDISDEHEPVEPAMFRRIDDNSAEVDAQIYVDELNRLMALSLPEDAGFDTLGGYVSTAMARIPEAGASFEQDGAKFTVLSAEPQKINRVRIDLIPHALAS